MDIFLSGKHLAIELVTWLDGRAWTKLKARFATTILPRKFNHDYYSVYRCKRTPYFLKKNISARDSSTSIGRVLEGLKHK
ncbi:hypothetical protein DAI22_06g198000 [Oryza sativa Japonica Group]|nr:hypothetical protein DAI22_06g198000 [Oryza sativa Japonica Group]